VISVCAGIAKKKTTGACVDREGASLGELAAPPPNLPRVCHMITSFHELLPVVRGARSLPEPAPSSVCRSLGWLLTLTHALTDASLAWTTIGLQA